MRGTEGELRLPTIGGGIGGIFLSTGRRVHYVCLTLCVVYRRAVISAAQLPASPEVRAASCSGHLQAPEDKEVGDDEECGWWRRDVVNVGGPGIGCGA